MATAIRSGEVTRNAEVVIERPDEGIVALMIEDMLHDPGCKIAASVTRPLMPHLSQRRRISISPCWA